jgi:hypothetical protein
LPKLGLGLRPIAYLQKVYMSRLNGDKILSTYL